DAATGKIRDEIVVPKDLSDGPVWKWMALRDGVLYALVGAEEIKVDVAPSNKTGLGHWPWGMWQGHDYKNAKTNFGFGRTFIAVDVKTKKIRWSYRDKAYLDSRGVCMNRDRLFFISPEKFLAALNVADGKLLWKNSDDALLQALGPNTRAQHYVTGYATTAYVKCSQDQVFFAGPQRSRLVAASAKDGKLLWQHRAGNLQLVLREDGLFCAGPGGSGMKLDYATGSELSKLPTRRACTRATGSIDSVFFRTSGGTVRLDVASNTAKHIAPMRPPCQDGVIISDGLLFWGPWMCGCQLSLYGHISLAPGGKFHAAAISDEGRLTITSKTDGELKSLKADGIDWPTYRGNNTRSGVAATKVPRKIKTAWTFDPREKNNQAARETLPSAPVTAGGMTFLGDRDGRVRALDSEGKLAWKAHVGGPVYFPPTIWQGRAFVGSADGRVHAYEAATGRKLWSYQVAPIDRWIPVYGKLMSTWPVAGGVLVEHGVLYAAAGIAHYDGTHVVALDAATGKLRWR
ncbi:MAG: PQQ-binding-like beta-propeller repeat protein, partial [Planctomycetales bacterium]